MLPMIHKLSRCSKARRLAYKNVFGACGNGRRSLTLTNQSRYIKQADNNLGILERCLGSLAAKNERNGLTLKSKVNVSDLNSVLANPRTQRFFSSEATEKKNCNDSESKEKKETPKGNNQKSESKKEKSSTEYDLKHQLGQIFFCADLLILVIGSGSFLMLLIYRYFGEQKISFQEFKERFLERGLVDHIVIVDNSVAQVNVRNSPHHQSGIISDKDAKYYIEIQSIESFEEELRKTQEALGIDSHFSLSYAFK